MKTTTAWAHLPNAKHIDWVLADVKQRPEVWDAAWGAAKAAIGIVGWSPAANAAWAAALSADRGAVWGASISILQDYGAAAMAALIAWDDSSLLLDMPVDAVKTLAAAGHHPAVLLLPAVIVKQGKEPTP